MTIMIMKLMLQVIWMDNCSEASCRPLLDKTFEKVVNVSLSTINLSGSSITEPTGH